jgi:hypothetical protein
LNGPSLVCQQQQYREAGANTIARSQGAGTTYAAMQNAAPRRRVFLVRASLLGDQLAAAVTVGMSRSRFMTILLSAPR